MRIIYDYDRSRQAVPHLPPSEHGRRETVVILSARGEREGGKRGDVVLGGVAYEVRVSEEALARNREVRSHERAHLAVLGGAAASPVLYDTVRGPGGESLATGGRIAVDMAEVPGDPEATLRKARTIIAAANAPGEPSAADVRVAARAYEMAAKARSELEEGSRFSVFA